LSYVLHLVLSCLALSCLANKDDNDLQLAHTVLQEVGLHLFVAF
jgi:hypothetical protein